MPKLFVTGAGFIGSAFIRLVLAEVPECVVVNFDALTYAGNLDNLTGLNDIRHRFVQGDIADRGAVRAALSSGHGRIEHRRITTSTALCGYTAWAGLEQVFEIERQVTRKSSGEQRAEIVYGVTSLSRERASAAQVLELVRTHWHIENKSHWVRDVTYDEDRTPSQSRQHPASDGGIAEHGYRVDACGWCNQHRGGMSPFCRSTVVSLGTNRHFSEN